MPTDLQLFDDTEKKTDSPSGRYAIAWGIPGVTDLQRFQQKNEKSWFDMAVAKARNYVVEKRNLYVVGTLPLHTRSAKWHDDEGRNGQFNYKEGGRLFPRLNHSYMSAFWSHNEEQVAVLQSDRDWYRAIYLGERRADGFHFIEIGDIAEDYIRAYLRHRYPREYQRVHAENTSEPYVNMVRIRTENDDGYYIKIEPKRVVLSVEAGDLNARKRSRSNSMLTYALIEMQIIRHGARLSARPVGLRVRKSS